MITLESHTATCAECWARGDKRVGEDQAYVTDFKEWGDPQKPANQPLDINSNSNDNSPEDEDIFVEAAEFLPIISSRPPTPVLYGFSENNVFDLSRICNSVIVPSVRWSYHARRHQTRNERHTRWEVESDTESFCTCLEYMDDEEQDSDDGTVYEQVLGEASYGEAFIAEISEKSPSEAEPDIANIKEKNAYYSILGYHVRDKAPLERLEDESLEFYGFTKEY
ncbi:hypothetical protein N7541_005487 [Penicillium brevicompactum]|uniref:Uncharacterized protein n=1 Tax=Penicillium brevicompactum TaxID=5074 RepID=A0A9W9UR48_PENBR|nr:hypothetical protein N7541_005487 [Penicillium brevicompactum]